MARSRHTITEPDMAAAIAYIDSKLRDPWWPSEDATTQEKAERGFRIAKRDPVTFNRWCEQHLNAANRS
jgi:hypothetical protein